MMRNINKPRLCIGTTGCKQVYENRHIGEDYQGKVQRMFDSEHPDSDL